MQTSALCLSVGHQLGCGKEGQRAGAPPIPPTCIADDTHSVKQWHTCHFSAVKVHVTSPLPCLYFMAIETLDSIIYKQSQDWCSNLLLLCFMFHVLSLRYFSALASVFPPVETRVLDPVVFKDWFWACLGLPGAPVTTAGVGLTVGMG